MKINNVLLSVKPDSVVYRLLDKTTDLLNDIADTMKKPSTFTTDTLLYKHMFPLRL